LLLLLVVIVFAAWPRPARLRLVAELPANGYTRLYSGAGLLMWTGHRSFQLYDWNGHPRWKVTADAPNERGWAFSPPKTGSSYGVIYELSPDGHTFAAALAHGPQTRVQIWRDGMLVARHDLPAHDLYPGLLACDDGSVFFWCRTQAPYRVWKLNDQRVSATGVLFRNAELSPDATAAVAPITTFGELTSNDFRYATVQLRDGRISTHHRYDATAIVSIDTPWRIDGRQGQDFTIMQGELFPGGKLVSLDGKVFGPAGRVKMELPDCSYTGSEFSGFMGKAGCISLVTGQSWECPNARSSWVRAVSANGEVVASQPNYPATPNLLEYVIEHFHPRDEIDSPPGRHTVIRIVRKPGKVCAVLPVLLYPEINYHMTMLHGWKQGADIGIECLSPDGHTVVFMSENRLLFYRW